MNEMIVEVINLESLKRMLIVIFALWVMALLVVFCDMWTGIKKARALNKPVNSRGLRRTFSKASDYWSILLVLFLVDVIGNIFPVYNYPYFSILGTMGVIYIELKSMLENLRAKRSAAAGIPDAVKQIIQCKSVKQAFKLFESLKGTSDTASDKQ